MSGTPRGSLTVRTLTMPADANPNGDIFGGWVVGHMDQAGGIAGVERAKGPVVTIAIDAMTFIKSIRVGDVLEVYTEIESVGRTSMKIHIEAWAQRCHTYRRDKVTNATTMAVHVPCPVRNSILLTGAMILDRYLLRVAGYRACHRYAAHSGATCHFENAHWMSDSLIANGSTRATTDHCGSFTESSSGQGI